MDLDKIFGPSIERLKPGMRHAGTRAEAFAFRILSRLDQIAENTHNPDFTENFRHFTLSGAPGTTEEVMTIPRGQVWELELFNVTEILGGGTAAVRILIDGNIAISSEVMAASTGKVVPGTGLKIRGGSVVTLAYLGTAVDVQCFLQFVNRSTDIPRATRTAGSADIPAELVGQMQDVENMLRHFAPWVSEGVAVIGEGSPDAG